VSASASKHRTGLGAIIPAVQVELEEERDEEESSFRSTG